MGEKTPGEAGGRVGTLPRPHTCSRAGVVLRVLQGDRGTAGSWAPAGQTAAEPLETSN